MNGFQKPIFIIGLPRSGSTLWLNIITRSPGIFRIGEMHFLTPWRKDFRYFLRTQIGDLEVNENIEKMINLFFSNQPVKGITGSFFTNDTKDFNDPLLKKNLYDKILQSDKSLRSIFKIIIEETTHFCGYNRCCAKFPVSIGHVPELLQWYPECKIIHIIRDPRAIALSKTNDPGGTAKQNLRYPYLKFILAKIRIFYLSKQYIRSSKLHYQYKNIKNYSLFRYEDLLFYPERIIKQLCKFTEIDFVPEMLEPQKGNEKGQLSSLTGKRQRKIDKEAAYRWTKKISNSDKAIITLLTKSSMKRFGYTPDSSPYFSTFQK